jgi:hypothetical protein
MQGYGGFLAQSLGLLQTSLGISPVRQRRLPRGQVTIPLADLRRRLNRTSQMSHGLRILLLVEQTQAQQMVGVPLRGMLGEDLSIKIRGALEVAGLLQREGFGQRLADERIGLFPGTVFW